jgi:hypothetical protein
MSVEMSRQTTVPTKHIALSLFNNLNITEKDVMA